MDLSGNNIHVQSNEEMYTTNDLFWEWHGSGMDLSGKITPHRIRGEDINLQKQGKDPKFDELGILLQERTKMGKKILLSQSNEYTQKTIL